MSMSLREQLLAAGLVSKKQVKQAEQQQRPQSRDRAGQAEKEKLAAQQAQAAKIARDQELNRQKEIQAEKKARRAEVKQLIEQHRLPKLETDDYYNFIAGRKIRRMSVDAGRRAALLAGALVVVRSEGRYEVVPKDIAERIHERDEHAVIFHRATDEQAVDEQDPYKDYVVPDDLMW